MNAPHRIRLRRPWQCRLQGDRVLWSRRFGRPTGLEPGDTVWIVVEQCPAAGALLLNGRPIGQLSSGTAESRFEVTALVEPRNEMVLDLAAVFPDSSAAPDSPPGVVSLEVIPDRRRG